MNTLNNHFFYRLFFELFFLTIGTISSLGASEAPFLTKDYDEEGQRFVLFFAVCDFERSDLFDSLPSSYNDMMYAKNEWLNKNPCFSPENIYFLHDHPEDYDENRLPTRENFYRTLNSILNRMTEKDSIYILFSSHGVACNNRSFICTKDTKDAHFSATETNTVSSEEKKRLLREETIRYGTEHNNMISVTQLIEQLQKANISKRILVFDACRENISNPREQSAEQDFLQEFQETLRISQTKGLATITSCSLKQRAQHIDVGDKTYGAFMYFFIEGLKGKADLTGSYDGQITLVEAYNYANIRTRQYTQSHYNDEQTPEFFEASGTSLSLKKETQSDVSSVDQTANAKPLIQDTNQTILARYDNFPKNVLENDIQFATRTGDCLARTSAPNYSLIVRVFDYVIDNQPNNALARGLRAYSARALGDYEKALLDQNSIGGDLRMFVKSKASGFGAYVYDTPESTTPIQVNGNKQGFFAGDQITIDAITQTRVHVSTCNNKKTLFSCWIDRDAVTWDREIARTSIIGTEANPGRNYTMPSRSSLPASMPPSGPITPIGPGPSISI